MPFGVHGKRPGPVLSRWQGLYGMAFGEANRDVMVPNALDTKFKLGAMNQMLLASGESLAFGPGG